MNDATVTLREAARLLGVSESHVARMIKRGELTWYRHPAYHKHARLQIPRSQVEAILTRSPLTNPAR